MSHRRLIRRIIRQVCNIIRRDSIIVRVHVVLISSLLKSKLSRSIYIPLRNVVFVSFMFSISAGRKARVRSVPVRGDPPSFSRQVVTDDRYGAGDPPDPSTEKASPRDNFEHHHGSAVRETALPANQPASYRSLFPLPRLVVTASVRFRIISETQALLASLSFRSSSRNLPHAHVLPLFLSPLVLPLSLSLTPHNFSLF